MDWKDDGSGPPPKDPPKVIFHGRKPHELPEHLRRIFGSPPPPDKPKPVPPPPPPPNTYHKKPKYWRMNGTGHMSQQNRIAGVMCAFVVGVCLIFAKLNGPPTRYWARYLGQPPFSYEAVLEERRKNQLWWDMVTNMPGDSYETNLSGDQYRNPRRKDDNIRWDLREVDMRIIGIRDMANPTDDPL